MCANIQSGLAQTCQGVCQTGEEAVPSEGAQHCWQVLHCGSSMLGAIHRDAAKPSRHMCTMWQIMPETGFSKDGTKCRVYLPSSPVAGICCHRLQQTCLSFCFLLPADESAAYARGGLVLSCQRGGKLCSNVLKIDAEYSSCRFL